MPVRYWTNQSVQMQSAIGAAQVIDAITKASNGAVTKNAGATLPANGAYLLLTIAGMRQINQRVVKVSGATGSTFNLGIDTTLFDTFVSGSYQVLTMNNAFTSVRDIQSSGGDPVFEDTTTIHDSDNTQAIVSSSPQTFSWTCDWEPTEATLLAANAAFVVRQSRAFRIADASGSEYLFYASVSAPLNPTVSGKKKVTPINLSLQGPGTSY